MFIETNLCTYLTNCKELGNVDLSIHTLHRGLWSPKRFRIAFKSTKFRETHISKHDVCSFFHHFPRKIQANHIKLLGGLVAIFYIFPLILGISHHPNWLILFRLGWPNQQTLPGDPPRDPWKARGKSGRTWRSIARPRWRSWNWWPPPARPNSPGMRCWAERWGCEWTWYTICI